MRNGGTETDLGQITVNASDAAVALKADNKTPADGDKFVITLTKGTLKATPAKSDVTVTGLPAGLDYSVANNAGKLEITVTGEATSAVADDVTLSVVVKSTAVTETGATDAGAATVTLTKNTDLGQITVNASDAAVALKADNKTPADGDKFVIALTKGTLKATPAKSDVTVTGLPAGLDYSVANNAGKLEITVTGEATSAVADDVTLSVVVKSTAVTETGATDAGAATVTLTKNNG